MRSHAKSARKLLAGKRKNRTVVGRVLAAVLHLIHVFGRIITKPYHKTKEIVKVLDRPSSPGATPRQI